MSCSSPLQRSNLNGTDKLSHPGVILTSKSQSLICSNQLPIDGYPSGFSTYLAGINSLRALCVTLDPGPRCECVKIANGSWQIVCRPTGTFADIQKWPNVVTRCVWGCSCYSTPDDFVPMHYYDALARVPGMRLTGKNEAN